MKTYEERDGNMFMKENKVHSSVITEETIKKMTESLNIQAALCLRGFDVIYWVELKFSWYTSKHYGWTPRSHWGYKQLMLGRFQALFMLAFSAKNVYGVMATTGSFKSQNFIYFLSKIASFFKISMQLFVTILKLMLLQK